jgi:ATP-binding cassette subfamily B protein
MRRLFRNRLFPREVGWLLSTAGKLGKLHAFTLTLITLGSALTLADPLILRWIIDRALPDRNSRLLLFAAVVFCVVFVARLALTYGAIMTSTIAAQKLIFRTRIQAVRRLNALPARYHEKSAVGDNLYRLDQDVSRIGELGAEIIPTVIRMVVMGAMVVTTMLLLDPWLTVMLLPLLVCFYQSQRRSQDKLRVIADSLQEQNGSVNSFLEEHLNGIVQLKLLNRTNARTRLLARRLAEAAGVQVGQRLAEVKFSFYTMAIIAAGNTLILAYGGHQVISGHLSVGTLVAFYGYLLRLFEPLAIATDLQARGQRVSASIGRVLEILEDRELQPAKRSSQKLSQLRPATLQFREVSFSYQQERRVLSDVSFFVGPGEKVALVGLNGSGKSTIGQIASGLYRPEQGSVLVNGRDAQELTPGSLRSVVSLVPQEPVIFTGTIKENLLYGNPLATESGLMEAAEFAQFDQVLRKLPAGMDELLGPRGNRLSGGEKKRLALARALLQKPEILILDEVTSALDEAVARSLLTSLDRFRNGNILIVISHRPATILWAERILVVHQGTIIDGGTHASLLERCPLYGEIFRDAEHASHNGK